MKSIIERYEHPRHYFRAFQRDNMGKSVSLRSVNIGQECNYVIEPY